MRVKLRRLQQQQQHNPDQKQQQQQHVVLRWTVRPTPAQGALDGSRGGKDLNVKGILELNIYIKNKISAVSSLLWRYMGTLQNPACNAVQQFFGPTHKHPRQGQGLCTGAGSAPTLISLISHILILDKTESAMSKLLPEKRDMLTLFIDTLILYLTN